MRRTRAHQVLGVALAVVTATSGPFCTLHASMRLQPAAPSKAPGRPRASTGALAEFLADEAGLEAWKRRCREEIIPDLSAWRLARLSNFLPGAVAEEALAAARGLGAWQTAAPAETDDAEHRFGFQGLSQSAVAFRALEEALCDLLPAIQSEPTRAEFRFGRYGPSDFIDTHTDEATYAAFRDDPALYSRRVALIWYLTKNWTLADGGSFVDDEPECVGGGVEIVPQFNEAVCFLVPRCHRVTPVLAAHRFRYSVYGWWYTEGDYSPPWRQ